MPYHLLYQQLCSVVSRFFNYQVKNAQIKPGRDENASGVVSGWASCIKSYQIEHEEQPAVVTLPWEQPKISPSASPSHLL